MDVKMTGRLSMYIFALVSPTWDKKIFPKRFNEISTTTKNAPANLLHMYIHWRTSCLKSEFQKLKKWMNIISRKKV